MAQCDLMVFLGAALVTLPSRGTQQGVKSSSTDQKEHVREVEAMLTVRQMTNRLRVSMGLVNKLVGDGELGSQRMGSATRGSQGPHRPTTRDPLSLSGNGPKE